MGPMSEKQSESLVFELMPLLAQALSQLERAEAYLMNPEGMATLLNDCQPTARLLKKRCDQMVMLDWHPLWQEIGDALFSAIGQLSTSMADLIQASQKPDQVVPYIQALRGLAVTEGLLYPIVDSFLPVGRLFLEGGGGPGKIDAATASAQVENKATKGPFIVEPPATGVHHIQNEDDQRGGYSFYVPRYYYPDRQWPVMVVLHGSIGHGAHYLWSWLKFARSRGLLVLAPTSLGHTWSLLGQNLDHQNILNQLNALKQNYQIDPERILLAGFSDGGTYALYTGLESNCPYSHFALMSATLHPAVLDSVKALGGKPVYWLHGLQDGLFPIEQARENHLAFSAVYPALTYQEVDGLGHAVARAQYPALLDWFGAPTLA